MQPIRVTSHAIERYLERVGADSEAEAMAVLTGPAVARAVAFGARIVRLARCRIVIEFTPIGAKVLTVLPIEGDRIPFQLIPPSRGGPPWVVAEPFPPAKETNHG